MEKLKEYTEFINPHWLVVVGTGMYIHLRQICIIGFCLDEVSVPPFDQSYASVLFIFSVLCLLAEYKLWPRSLKEPPIQLLFIYEMLVAALATNLAMRVIWTPLMHVLCCLTQESSKWLLWLNSTLGLDRHSVVNLFAYYMESECAATHMAFCMSVLSFVWMLDATESLDGILDMWAKILLPSKKRTGRRITFTCPEVTDWYFYVLTRCGLKRRREQPVQIHEDIPGPVGSDFSNDSAKQSFPSYFDTAFFVMAKLLCTIPALLLNVLGLTIFQTCFANAMEDEAGESLLVGPPITYFLFASGVYTIIMANTLFPQSFRKPNNKVLCVYEFLVTAFFLEFTAACIWTPVDVLVLTTMPKTICNTLTSLGLEEAAETFTANESLMAILTYAISSGFFLLTLHITKSVDFTVLMDCGPNHFASYLKTKLSQKILSEWPRANRARKCRCRMRRKGRSKSRANNYT